MTQRRVIEDQQLDEAALGLAQPDTLASIRQKAAAAPFEHDDESGGAPRTGQYVEVTLPADDGGSGGGSGGGRARTRRGVFSVWEAGAAKVTYSDGTQSGWLELSQLRTSGYDETGFLQRAMAAHAGEVREACARMPAGIQHALAEVRRRVLRDELPLLSMLQAEPLQMQSSHLSFQEYFAATVICQPGTRLSGSPPWQWPAWWANTLTIGADIGERFRQGLCKASGVEGDALHLEGKLSGDRPTVARVLKLPRSKSLPCSTCCC